MDGTLWDSASGVAASWNEEVKRLGYSRAPITTDDIMGVMGKPMDEFADIIFGDIESKEERMNLLKHCGEYENEYLRVHGGELYPELEETLIQLKEKYHLYIVSNCQSGYIEAFLEHYGFDKYFEDIECFGNNNKPKGENIALLAGRNKLDRAWYIGDIQGDYDATMEAGLEFIHAAYGFGTINADVPKISSFNELPKMVEELS